MALKTLFGLFFVIFQGGFKNAFEIVGVSQWGSPAILCHRIGSGNLTHIEGMIVTELDSLAFIAVLMTMSPGG